MSSSTKRPPCDQCYQRRVRCRSVSDYLCSACIDSGLSCTRVRVRGKRGPKKLGVASKLSKATSESHFPWTSPSDVIESVDSHQSNLTGGQHPDTIVTRQHHESADRTLHNPPLSLPGRAQIQTINSPGQFITVNELAEFVLDDHGLDIVRRDSRRLLGFRNSSSSQLRATHDKSPHSTDPTLSLLSTSSDKRDTTSTPGSRRQISSTTSVTSLTPGLPLTLDSTALALVAGLPLRFGQEIIRCVDVYFALSHHVVPILHEESFRRMIAFPAQLTTPHRALLLAFCAVTRLRSVHMVGPAEDREARELGCVFLEQCLRLQSDIDYQEDKSPYAIITAYLLHVAYACLCKDKTARYYLRAAISLAMDIDLHKKGDDSDYSGVEIICAQRTFALLYVIERATAVLDRHDILLFRNPPFLPDFHFDETDRKALAGFRCLFDLFRLLENEVVIIWCSDATTLKRGADEARHLITSAQAYLSTTTFNDRDLNDFQRADIQVTQQWLRLIFWQMAMRLGFLSNWSDDPVFSYNYPVELGKELCSILHSLPEAAIQAHHFSIYNKIFEIAYSLMDILMISGAKEGPGIYELKELFRYLATSPITHMTYVRVLMEKIESQEPQIDTMDDISNS